LLLSLQNDEDNSFYLIVGLGNPGKAYDMTRHNVGFEIVQAFARSQQWNFRSTPQLKGELAQGTLHGKKVILLKPMTYMNLSGHSVQVCAHFFKVALSHLLVISDDIALPLGSLRFRGGGSAGGHKGLISIEEALGTKEYPRLRVGVGDRTQGDLADYVLGSFTSEERVALPSIVERAEKAIDLWIKAGIEVAIKNLLN
jgi:PTH1 family peptidyl-tRNA hydrolase